MLTEDRDLTPSDVQRLSSADEVASFFLTLGYDVDARIDQTPAALGVTSTNLARRIKHIERIADHEGELEVYLFEMKSMRVSDRQALARHFRNLSGDFLLILTSDYETLDFVLLERTLPEAGNGRMARKRVAVHPHVLTVDRHNPDAVTLRVLRRFSYTEADPQFQFDKLLSAYTVAEWSEPLFNNRALFSDYYLNQRLQESEEWKEDPQPIYRGMRNLLLEARARLAGENEERTLVNLLEPALDTLGFGWRRVRASSEDTGEPDYRLHDPDGAEDDPPLALCLAYKWNRYLDGRDETRDSDRPDQNPGARVVSVLESGEAPYVILTNGKLWRLYAAQAHSRATNYYEIDLEETLNSPDREEAIRYFWLFFRAPSFVPHTVMREGEKRSLCFLDQLVMDSETYAKELGERLKNRVFEQIFPHLAEGFIEYIRQSDGKDVELGQERLDGIYQGTLTFLYRLMFVLYAESRDLLPVKDQRGYWEVSLSKLKSELARSAGDIADDAEDRLKSAYRADSTEIYERLADLFAVIDKGDPDLNVPRYNGGLFLTAPEDRDDSPEAVNARFLSAAKIPDRYLAPGLDRLARDVDEKTLALAMIDFKSLGVRQLGSIYEGLLEFKLRIAPERMAIVKGKRTEEIIPYREAKKKKRKILTEGRGEDRRERRLPKGAVYLENTRQERKATGSYYTPDHIVKYIVEHTVGPVLQEKLGSLRPQLRELERRYRNHRKNAIAKSKLGRYEDPEKFWNNETAQELAYDVLDIKVLDPAMGSGHFLVEAVDCITDHLLHFLNGFPDNPVRASLERSRQAILASMDDQGVTIDPDRLNDVALLKRQVLKRCVYGVELNPMAVELAKVSLWLDAFTLGAPLSFLDHHLRYGNSLIGAMAREADCELRGETSGQPTLWGGPFQNLLRQAEIMLGIGQLADATIEQVHESANLYRRFEEAAKPYKQLLDVFVIRDLGVERADEFLRLYGPDVMTTGVGDLSKPYRELLADRERLYSRHAFFHWDLEFPEAFIDMRNRRWKETGGFDALVANPPHGAYVTPDAGDYLRKFFRVHRDSAMQFVQRAQQTVRQRGYAGLVMPKPMLYSASWTPARAWLLQEGPRPLAALDAGREFEGTAHEQCVVLLRRLDLTAPWQPILVGYCGRETTGFLIGVKTIRRLDMFPTTITGAELIIAERVLERSLNHDCLQAWRGLPKRLTGSKGRPAVSHEDLGRYRMEEPRAKVDTGECSQNVLRRLTPPKLIARRLMKRAVAPEPHVIVTCVTDRNGTATLETVANIQLSRDCTFLDLNTICAILNSSFVGWWVNNLVYTRPQTSMDFDDYYVRKIPIPRMDLAREADQRARLSRRARELYDSCVRGGDTKVLECVEHYIHQSEMDVPHHLLALLGAQMIGLNEQSQAEVRRFIDWLETHIGAKIGELTGKTLIHGYVGDYQKGEPTLPFEELLDRLHSNRSRVRANLGDPAFVARLRREYAASLELLMPIKERLAATDRLIDQVVYRLYGLSDEDVAIVERQV